LKGKKKYYYIIQTIKFICYGILVLFFYWILLQDAYYILKYSSWYFLFLSLIFIFFISNNQIHKQLHWLRKILTLSGILGLFAVFGQVLGMMMKFELMKDIMELVFCIAISIVWVVIGWEWKNNFKGRSQLGKSI